MALPRQQTRTVAGVTYTLTRRRVRNINLRVRADGSVAASAAPRVSVMKVDAFVASKADWVRSAQARVAARREQEAAQQPELPTRAEALAHIQVLCRAYYPQFAATCPGGHMPKIAVRDMTTRWGSCSLKPARWLLRGGCVWHPCPRRNMLWYMSSAILPTPTMVPAFGRRWRQLCRTTKPANDC